MKERGRKVFILSILGFAIAFLSSVTMAEASKMENANQARRAALRKVPSAQVIEVDSDIENGELVYEVELHKAGKEYTLEYRASDGKLIKYEWDINNPSYTNQNKKNLSKETIRKKALSKVKNATVLSTSLKYDDGLAQYKVRLSKGSKAYELVYNSKTGKLLEYQWEVTNWKSASSSYIGTAKAKAIALKKVPNATVIKIEFDRDDGVAVYEVSMVKGIYEYEVKINAKTGSIIEFEKDIDD